MSRQRSSKDTLKIVFDANAEYAAFLHPDIDNLTVVPARSAVDGGGSIDDGRLLIAFDGDGIVTDIEMFTQNVPICQFPKPARVEQQNGQIDVLVAVPLSATWAPARTAGQAWIGLNEPPLHGRAVRVGGSGIVLSIGDGGFLEGILITGIVVDPTSSLERDWLDGFSTE